MALKVVVLNLTDEIIQLIDQYRREQPFIPSRSEVVRVLLKETLTERLKNTGS